MKHKNKENWCDVIKALHLRNFCAARWNRDTNTYVKNMWHFGEQRVCSG